jgi:hypothetical protein
MPKATAVDDLERRHPAWPLVDMHELRRANPVFETVEDHIEGITR